MDITLLGTSGSSPTKERMMPSVAITYEGETLLFDCGEGTQMQMLKYGINASRIKAIFITHAHGDHIIGIAGLVRSMALNGRSEALSIFIPKGYERVIQGLLTFDKAIICYRINVIGAKPGKVYSGKGFHVRAFRLNHTISTLGYAFKEEDRLRFDKDKTKKLGMKGTMFSEMLSKKKLRIKNKVVALSSITSIKKGRKVVYASDTRPSTSTVSAAKDADLLIHESSYSDQQANLAKERKHSTASEAARIAYKSKAKGLVLTHFSARYSDISPLLAEARKIFSATTAGSDGYKIKL